MKYFVKTIEILLIGLITAVFIYPLLHEGGHGIFAVISGTEVFEFNVFPVSSVLCNMANASVLQYFLIGLGGMFFPLVISVSFRPKHFVSWYLCFAIKVISMIAFGISAVGIVMYKIGLPIENEDITKTMAAAPNLWVFLLLFCLFAELILILSIIRSQPIVRIKNFYEK